VKRPLHELGRGDVFRTADGRLWVRTHESLHPDDRFYCVGILHDVAVALAGDTEVEPIDLPALLVRLGDLEKENRDLRGMVADLWDESRAARLVAEAERGAVLEALAALLPASVTHDQTAEAARVVGLAVDAVKARGPWHPPVPPCRLEGAVREAVGLLTEAAVSMPGRGVIGYGWAKVEAALARLRAALGEG
jgi:hypothetical protein